MKHFIKRITLVLFAALLLASCSDIDSDEPTSQDGLITLRIAVDDASRTAYPQVDVDSFKKFTLSCDGTDIGKWTGGDGVSAYAVMNSDSVTVAAGTHTFVLTGTDDYVTYKGTQTVTVTQSTVLSFTLSFASVANSSSSGYINYSITFPYDSANPLVKRITLVRYAYDSVTSRTLPENAEGTTDYTYIDNYSYSGSTEIYPTEKTKKWYNFTKGMTGGKYLYECNFYDKDDTLLGSVQEIVYVSYGCTTYLNIVVSDFDDIWTISYNNIDDATLASGSYPLQYTARSNVILPVPVKEGFTFEGWYDAADQNGQGTGTKVESWASGEKTGNVTLYAKWTQKKCTVAFFTSLYSDATPGDSIETQEILYGDYAYAPETTPTKDGYELKGWFVDDSNELIADANDIKVLDDINVYAVWGYDIAFNKNAAEATGTMEAQTVLSSALKLKNTLLGENAFDYTGHTFMGWATTEGATEAVYADGQDIAEYIRAKKALYGATTLYAVWHDDSTGSVVSFDTLGGSIILSKEVPSDSTATEPEAPAKADYQFLGWYTGTPKDDGTVTLGEKYDFASVVTKDITLYAKWWRNTYYVSADGKDSTGTGLAEAPFASISQAVSTIASAGNEETDFTIVVSGEIKERPSISSSLTTDMAKSLTIRGATDNDTDILNGNGSGTVFGVYTAVPITLSDITITNKTTYNATGVSVSDGARVTLASGARVTGFTDGSSSGVGVYVSGNLIMEDGAEISNNTNKYSYGYGAGVFVNGGGIFTMNGGVITGNKKINCSSNNYGGGGVYVNGSFIMNGGEITNNSARYAGGGVYFNSSAVYTCSMTGGTISNNTVDSEMSGYGGGVYISNSTQFTMTGGIISDNTASYGGGAYKVSGTFSMGGSAYIPAGDDGKNDVRLGSGTITVASELASAGATSDWAVPVATISKSIYSTGTAVLTAADGVTLSDEVGKFALANAGYTIADTGKIAAKTKYSITYKDRSNSTFSGTHQSGYPTYHVVGGTTTLLAPTKNHYAFDGWYTESDCSGTAVTELTDENCTAAITLYAKWTENENFAVTYLDVGGTSFSGTTATTRPVKHYVGETETLPKASKTDYVFIGWFAASDGSGTAITELNDTTCTADLTLYAKWNREWVTAAVNNTSADDTVIPTGVAIDDFDSFTLTATGTGSPVTLGTWAADTANSLTAYQVMRCAEITLADGIYTFVLTGTEANGATYTATLTDTAFDSSTELEFALAISDVSVYGIGSLAFSINYTSATAVSKVAELYASADGKTYTKDDYRIGTRKTWDATTGTYVSPYNLENIPAGTYLVVVTFTDTDGNTLKVLETPVWISAGRKSAGTVTVVVE